VLGRWRATDKALTGRADLTVLASLTDMRDQLGRLVHRGFVGEAGPDRLRRYPVYLAALDQRRARLDEQPARDRQLLAQVADLQAAYLHQVDALPEGRPPSAALREVRWLLEEYRVSLWAQQLGTTRKVSDQRIRKALAAAS
jgi:ATP-dependent helicase HrpA